MISLADEPFIVTFKDGTEAEDGEDILLLGVSGPDEPKGLIMAARELLWVDLDTLLVSTVLASYQRVDEDPEDDET